MVYKLKKSEVEIIGGGACHCFCKSYNSSSYVEIVPSVKDCQTLCQTKRYVDSQCVPFDKGDVMGNVISLMSTLQKSFRDVFTCFMPGDKKTQ